jgi:hypothetical protein
MAVVVEGLVFRDDVDGVLEANGQVLLEIVKGGGVKVGRFGDLVGLVGTLLRGLLLAGLFDFGRGRQGDLLLLRQELVNIDAGIPFLQVGDAGEAVALPLQVLHGGGVPFLKENHVLTQLLHHNKNLQGNERSLTNIVKAKRTGHFRPR